MIAVHTLIIAWDSDRLIVPENSAVLAAAIPDTKLVTAQDAVHFSWIEKPAESARALIDFFAPLG